MPEKIDYKKIASILTAGEPMAFKAYPDGSLVVIAHDGKKHRFPAEQVLAVQPKPKPVQKRGHPSKTESKIVKGG
jgi:hypothetical protein